jgi:hypothetical protein
MPYTEKTSLAAYIGKDGQLDMALGRIVHDIRVIE